MTKNSAELFLPAPSRLDRPLGGSRRRFYVALVVAVALALAALFVTWREQAGRIELINEINRYFQREVALLDKDIVELRNYRALITALLVRKHIVEALQVERGLAVSILNFFVEKMPAGVMLTGLEREGRSLLVRGVSRAAIRERGSTLHQKADGLWVERPAGFMQSPLMDLVRNMEAHDTLFASVELLQSRNIDGEQKAMAPAVDAQSFTLKVMLAAADRKGDGSSRDDAETGRGIGKHDPIASSPSTGDDATPIIGGLLALAMALGIAIWRRRRPNLKPAREAEAVSKPSLPRRVWERLVLTMQAVDRRDITSWPGTLRAFVVLLLLAITLLGGYWLLIDPQIDELEARSARETELREEWAGKKHQAVNLDLYSEQAAQADLVLGTLLRQLPNHRIEANAFMGLLANLAINQGLSGPQLSPGQERPLEFCDELPVRISASGSFVQMGRFLAEISQLDRLAIVRDFSIRTESGRLSLDATVLIFRFVSDDELADRRKAARGEKK